MNSQRQHEGARTLIIEAQSLVLMGAAEPSFLQPSHAHWVYKNAQLRRRRWYENLSSTHSCRLHCSGAPLSLLLSQFFVWAVFKGSSLLRRISLVHHRNFLSDISAPSPRIFHGWHLRIGVKTTVWCAIEILPRMCALTSVYRRYIASICSWKIDHRLE